MFKKVKKLLCILSVTTLLIGSYTLPSFATPSSTTNWLGLDKTQKGPIHLTDQQKKIFLDDINKNTKLPKKFGKIDISSATNAELEDYGIPDRPTDPQELKQWNEFYGTVKEVIKPEFSIGDAKGGLIWPNLVMDRIWSGCVNKDAALPVQFNSVGYQNVIGMFTVPNLKTDYTPSDVMIWPGIGDSKYLVQAGIRAYNKDPNIYSYEAFWEFYTTDSTNHYYGTPNIPINNLPIHPNDYISVGITLQGSGGSAAIMRINNQTTGQMVNLTEPTYGCVDNSCAEWITEAPQDYQPPGSKPWGLANYGTVNWQGQYCYGSLGATQAQSACIANSQAIHSVVEGITMTGATPGVVRSYVSDPTFYNTFSTTYNAPY